MCNAFIQCMRFQYRNALHTLPQRFLKPHHEIQTMAVDTLKKKIPTDRPEHCSTSFAQSQVI